MGLTSAVEILIDVRGLGSGQQRVSRNIPLEHTPSWPSPLYNGNPFICVFFGDFWGYVPGWIFLDPQDSHGTRKRYIYRSMNGLCLGNSVGTFIHESHGSHGSVMNPMDPFWYIKASGIGKPRWASATVDGWNPATHLGCIKPCK